MLNSGNGDTSAISEPASQISFDNNDTINYEEQLQKQKDLEACFGFKVCLFFFLSRFTVIPMLFDICIIGNNCIVMMSWLAIIID